MRGAWEISVGIELREGLAVLGDTGAALIWWLPPHPSGTGGGGLEEVEVEVLCCQKGHFPLSQIRQAPTPVTSSG